jgi:hypothetical protein
VNLAIRGPIALVTVCSGVYLVVLHLLAGLSFWYLIAIVMILIAGVSGFFDVAAIGGIALPPLIAITPLFLSADIWHKESIGLLVALGFAWAAAVASILLSRTSLGLTARRYLLISSGVLAVGFGIDRAYTNKIQVHSFEMNWAVGKNDPFETGSESLDGQIKVTVYRQDRGSTCYDSIYSNELAKYLERIRKPTIHVEYELFYDFGKSRAYNVRSIEGMVITKEGYPVLHAAGASGGIIGDASSTGGCDR